LLPSVSTMNASRSYLGHVTTVENFMRQAHHVVQPVCFAPIQSLVATKTRIAAFRSGAAPVDDIRGVVIEVGQPAITLGRLFFRPTASC